MFWLTGKGINHVGLNHMGNCGRRITKGEHRHRQYNKAPRMHDDMIRVIRESQGFCWNPSITGTKSEYTVIATSKGIIPVSRPVLCPTMTPEIEGQTYVRPQIWETV